jgi:hypothetical protein
MFLTNRVRGFCDHHSMTITIPTAHANELILVDDVLDPGGSAVVALGLTNHDGSDTFPGRTLTPHQAEELAASLAQAAAAARATAGLAPAPLASDQAHGDTLQAVREAVPLTSTAPFIVDGQDEQADAIATPPAPAKTAPSEPPKPTAKPRAARNRTSSHDDRQDEPADASAKPPATVKAAPSRAPKPTAKPPASGKQPSASGKQPSASGKQPSASGKQPPASGKRTSSGT